MVIVINIIRKLSGLKLIKIIINYFAYSQNNLKELWSDNILKSVGIINKLYVY